MSDSRETILRRVRDALQPLTERAAYPNYPDNVATMAGFARPADPWSVFAGQLRKINGTPIDSLAELVTWLRSQGQTRGYCDPELWPRFAPQFGAEFKVETVFDRKRVDDYQFGITRAAGAIAETGTVILTDATTSTRLSALAPWVHVAVVSPSQIFPDIAAAVAALGSDPNIVWCTGPSKTSDVEGILVQGVHGPGIQIALKAS